MTNTSLSTLCELSAANIRNRLRSIRYDDDDEESLSGELAAYFLFSSLGILLHNDSENFPSPWTYTRAHTEMTITVSYYNVVLDYLLEHYPEVLL